MEKRVRPPWLLPLHFQIYSSFIFGLVSNPLLEITHHIIVYCELWETSADSLALHLCHPEFLIKLMSSGSWQCFCEPSNSQINIFIKSMSRDDQTVMTVSHSRCFKFCFFFLCLFHGSLYISIEFYLKTHPIHLFEDIQCQEEARQQASTLAL